MAVLPPTPTPAPNDDGIPPAAQSLAAFQAQRANAMQPSVRLGYDQPEHEWLKAELAKMGVNSPDLHLQHVLPGAKRAITHQLLEEWQADGLTETQMVARINEQFDEANRRRMNVFIEWRDGEHLDVLNRAREREEKRLAAYARMMSSLDQEESTS